MNLLQKYIQLVCEGGLISAKELAHSDAKFEEKDALIKAMNDLKLELIPRGDNEIGKLGQGAFGSVFEVEKDGKHLVVKLTTSSKDAEAYEKIAEIRKQVPAVPASALPLIYGQKKYGNYYVTIMEPLSPLSSNIKYNLFGVGESGISPKKIKTAATEFLNNSKKIISSVLNKNQTKQVVMSKQWLDFKKKISSDENLYVPKSGSSHGTKYKSADELIFNSIYPTLDDHQLTMKVTKALLKSWEEILPYREKGEFPESGSGGDEISNISNKKAMKLQTALRWLSQKGYIKNWGDSHQDNVMIRKSTGDYVVADVGLFLFNNTNTKYENF